MTKGIKIIISLILLMIVVGSGFLWWIWKEEKELGAIPFEEFIQKEIDGEKIIENKKVRLRIKIPQGWQTEEGIGGGSVVLISPDFKPFPEFVFPYFPEKGCLVEIKVTKVEFVISGEEFKRSYEADFLREEIEKYLSHSQTEKDPFHKVIMISGFNGLETTTPFSKEEISGKTIRIEIPKDKRVYSFGAFLFGEDKEKCEQQFDKFLETVSISSD